MHEPYCAHCDPGHVVETPDVDIAVGVLTGVGGAVRAAAGALAKVAAGETVSEVGATLASAARAVGSAIRSAAKELFGVQQGRLIGRHKIGILNRNNYARLGWSWKGAHNTGRNVIRISIGRKGWPIHFHITIWPWGPR